MLRRVRKWRAADVLIGLHVLFLIHIVFLPSTGQVLWKHVYYRHVNLVILYGADIMCQLPVMFRPTDSALTLHYDLH